MNPAVMLHVYFSASLDKTAAKLNLTLPKGDAYGWTTLIKSPYGEFGVESQSGFAFKITATPDALDSIIPVLIGTLQRATSRPLRLVLEYSTSDRALARLIEPWRQKLFDNGFEVL